MNAHTRLTSLLAAVLVAWPASAPLASDNLPNLGTVAESAVPLAEESRIGRDIQRSLQDDGDVIDDAEINDYLNDLGGSLVAAAQPTPLPISYFVVRDASINAFALPGGVIGVHSGLVTATQSEGELASVLAHETAHVTQRHLARMYQSSSQNQLWLWAAILAGIVAGSRSGNSDMAVGALNAGVGLGVSQQLSYSRDFEREADRMGMQYLAGAGFDPRNMPLFFERLQQSQRHNDNNAFGFLRTHPLTVERLSESQARAQSYPLKMRLDSLDYLLMREKLRVATLSADEVLPFYSTALTSRRYLNRGAMLYGLLRAQLAHGNLKEAQALWPQVKAALPAHPSLLLLEAELQRAAGQPAQEVQTLQQALAVFPSRRALRLELIDALLQSNRQAEARQAIDAALARYQDSPQLWRLAARSYGEADSLRYHAALGNAFFFEQKFESARVQYQLATQAPGDDFYLRSSIEARLREIGTKLKPGQGDDKR
ncbi:M48 family metalloprotease [Vogesella sp. LIG4]|uniref:beta-barrel assembly-enhancing protease n=1 Tax=Vogesella sp. LIG4 TaxID=1192162 RepID=UPI0008200F6D|nr:M48 family metalloprotease [Vogesella sp. LIG4]SCK11856.1 Putative Zn-dependent protease, contains TPR repeats [Vogesella sp. LIG4]